MSDDILAALSEGAEVELQGGFSIDKEKARVKMRQFQLSDPRRYVLLLVQAANQQGATQIEFSIDADDMEVRFDGEGFSKDDLDDLFVSLFGDRGESNLRARQELAVALNAALALNPRWVRVRSHRNGSGAKLELRPGPDELPAAESCDIDEKVTVVHVKERFRPGLFLQFVKNLRGQIAEERILQQRVQYCEVPIFLDGQRISHGIRIGAAIGRVYVGEAGLHGEVGFIAEGEPGPARLEVLNAGVWLSSRPLPGFEDGFVAMVDATHLRKDVSQTDVVQDETYDAMIAVLRVAQERSLHRIVAACKDRPSTWFEMPEWFRVAMPEKIAQRVKSPWRLEEVGDVLDDYLQLPVWKQLRGDYVSTADLRTRETVDLLSRVQRPVTSFHTAVRAERSEDRAALRVLCGDKVRDRTSAYESGLKREVQKAALFNRTWSTTLGEGMYYTRSQLDVSRLEGEVAIRAGGNEEATLHLVYEGNLLESITLDPVHVAIPGLIAVVQAGYNPTADWDRSKRDEVLARVIHHVGKAFQSQLHMLPSRFGLGKLSNDRIRTHVLALQHALLCQGFERSLYRAAGFSPRSVSRWLKRFGRTRNGTLFTKGEAHPLMRCQVFQSVDRRWHSVADLRARHGEDAPLMVMVRPQAGTVEVLSGAEDFVIATSVGYEILREALGSEAVRHANDEYAHLSKRAQWLRNEVQPLVPSGQVVRLVDVPGKAMKIVAGVLRKSLRQSYKSKRAELRLFLDERPLETITLNAAVPGLSVALNWDEMPTVGPYEEVDPAAMQAFVDVMMRVPVALLEDHLQAFRDEQGSDELAAALQRLLLAPFVEEGWLVRFVELKGSLEPDVLQKRYDAMLAGYEAVGGDLDEDAFEALAAGRTPEAVLDQEVPGLSPLRVLAKAVLKHFDELAALPMFPALGGDTTLNAMLEAFERHSQLLSL
ncbi:MAG: hypothetical protein AAGA54_36295, partial [Myxococcota bacterium]